MSAGVGRKGARPAPFTVVATTHVPHPNPVKARKGLKVWLFQVHKLHVIEGAKPGERPYRYFKLTGCGPNEPTDFGTASKRRTRVMKTGRTE